MERLTPLATAFLDAEDVDPSASLAIGSLAVFAGPAPSFEEFSDSIAGRLPLIPRYRQKLFRVPFGLAAPAWVDDADFDLSQHVLATAVPAPGGREEVGELVSTLMSTRMDRDRPLWEYWFVEGLPQGRWALLSKLHHCVVDGVSGTDLYQLVLDPGPTPRGPVPDTWEPERPPSLPAATAQAVWDLATTPVPVARALVTSLATPRRLLHTSVDAARGLAAIAAALRPVPRTSLTGPLEGGRRYAWTDLSLDDVRAVRRRHDVTVNDVALTAITGGFRLLLEERGEHPGAHALRSLVPVSTRAPGAESILDNRVSLMLPYLPVDVADPVERLRAVRMRVRSLRARHEPEAGEAVTTAAELAPFPPVDWWIRLGLRVPQRQITTVTTNVPGPRTTLYALGREAEQMLPYVPIADRVRIGVAMFSYRDTLTVGLTGDHDTAADLPVLAEAIAASMAELVEAADRAAT